MSKQDRLLSDEEVLKELEILRFSSDPLAFLNFVNTQKRLYAEPLINILDKLGVEKCPVCTNHLIDDDMNICENCNYGVHEWCTAYSYDGEGEYPSESAFSICKNCYKPEQKARIK